MRRSKLGAVGDTTRTRARQSLRREDGAGIIGGASRRAVIDPRGMLDRPGVVSRGGVAQAPPRG